MELTDKEREILKLLKNNRELLSKRLKMIFNVSPDRKALTREHLPNIRHLLYSYMTAYARGAYRGGWCWLSVVSWKGKLEDFEKFLIDHGI